MRHFLGTCQATAVPKGNGQRRNRARMPVDYSPLVAGQLAAAGELAAEFLGQAGVDAVAADFAAYPELVVAFTLDGAMAGAASGHPDGEHGATLDGITVDDAHTAHGLSKWSTWSSSRAASGTASTWTA